MQLLRRALQLLLQSWESGEICFLSSFMHLSVPGALQESQGLSSDLGLPPGHWSGQVVRDQREHLHCMDQTTTCCDIPLIQRASIACEVCAASCCIIHQQ